MSEVPSEVPAVRYDPLRVFRFKVSLGGRAVAGVQKVSGLRLTVGARETWEGGNALHRYANPDRATWDPITLHQGLALDDTLEAWANAVVDYLRTGRAPSGQAVKRDVQVDVLAHHWPPDPSAPRSFEVRNAWISKFEAVPALDATGQEVALLSVELTHEGWRPLHATIAPAAGGATGPPDLLTQPGATDLVLSPRGSVPA